MKVEVVSRGRTVHVMDSPPVNGPSRVTVRVAGNVVVDIELNDAKDRYVVTAIRGADLTGEVLRTIPISTVVREAIEDELVDRETGQPVLAAFTRLVGEHPDVFRESFGRLTDKEKAEVVSALYRLGYLLGSPPIAYILEHIGTSRSTASRAIREAREKFALLAPTSERKAGV